MHTRSGLTLPGDFDLHGRTTAVWMLFRRPGSKRHIRSLRRPFFIYFWINCASCRDRELMKKSREEKLPPVRGRQPHPTSLWRVNLGFDADGLGAYAEEQQTNWNLRIGIRYRYEARPLSGGGRTCADGAEWSRKHQCIQLSSDTVDTVGNSALHRGGKYATRHARPPRAAPRIFRVFSRGLLLPDRMPSPST